MLVTAKTVIFKTVNFVEHVVQYSRQCMLKSSNHSSGKATIYCNFPVTDCGLVLVQWK